MSSGFETLRLGEIWLGKLSEAGIVTPTPVQAQAIPEILAGRDVIAQSQTGTGKTLAYLLPVLERLDPRLKAVQAVVLVPTRELGMQIVREAERLMQGSGLSVQALIGGAAIGRQIDKLKLHPQLVVGTPGRVQELVKARKLSLHNVRTVVVDEVDQVFDLGSAREVEAMLNSAIRDRQILFFSATIPEAVIGMAERWMKQPVTLKVHSGRRTAETIEHFYFVCDERDKIDLLRRLVRTVNPRSAIVFINDVDKVAEVVAKIKHAGLSIEALYADAGKQERARTMQAFRGGRFQLLLATDIAARGLDIESVTHVFNLDLPMDADRYVHRVGRTGRMGRRGTAITITMPKERFVLDKFAKALGIDIQPKALFQGKIVDPEDDRSVAARRRRKAEALASAGRSGGGRRGEEGAGVAGKPRASSAAVAASTMNAGQRSTSGVTKRDGMASAGEAPHVRGGSAGPVRAGDASPTEQRGASPGRPNPAKGEGRRMAAAESTRGKAKRKDEGKNKGAPRWLKNKPQR